MPLLNPVLTPETAAIVQSLVKPTAQSEGATPPPVLPTEAPPAPESLTTPSPAAAPETLAAPPAAVAGPAAAAPVAPPTLEEPPPAPEAGPAPLTLEGVLGTELFQRLQSQAFDERMTPGKALALGAIGYSRPDLVPTLMAQEERKSEGARDLLAQISAQVNSFNRTVEEQRGAERRSKEATERSQLVALNATARQVLAKAGEQGVDVPETFPTDVQGLSDYVAVQGSKVASDGYARQAAAKVYAEMETQAKNATLRGDVAQQFRDRMEIAGVPPALVLKYGGAYEKRLQILAAEQQQMAQRKMQLMLEEGASLRFKVSDAQRKTDLAEQALAQGDRRIALGLAQAGQATLLQYQQSLIGLQAIYASQMLEDASEETLQQTRDQMQQMNQEVATLAERQTRLIVSSSGPLLDMITGQGDVELARQIALDQATTAVQRSAYLAQLVGSHIKRMTGMAEEPVVGMAEVQSFIRSNPQSTLADDYYDMAFASLLSGRTAEEIQQLKDAFVRVMGTDPNPETTRYAP